MNEFKLKGFVFFLLSPYSIFSNPGLQDSTIFGALSTYTTFTQSSYQFNFQISWTALVTPTMTKETTHDGSKY